MPRKTKDAPAREKAPLAGDIYTVSRLNAEARFVLESGFAPIIWVEGELSNLARPSSGHMYFSLKDSAAQVRCAMFRGSNTRLSFAPSDGLHVLVRARVSLYEGRGEFQLIAEHMEAAGDGLLRRAFELLKAKLAEEGLFDEENKKPLPEWPRQVGVITSPTGAAIRDIVTTLHRRFPALPVIVYPTPVQGEEAVAKIVLAIETAVRRAECDVLILARGGGSLEDLWCFNDERVARAIFACPIPIVSGIGHEIDFTIADFVADRRAPTPTAAAELVTPDIAHIQHRLSAASRRLAQRMNQIITQTRQRLRWGEHRLNQQHPRQRLLQRTQHIDQLELRLRRAIQNRINTSRARLARTHAHLRRHTPDENLRALRHFHGQLQSRLRRAAIQILSRRTDQLAFLGQQLHTLSPLATLDRGYALVSDTASGKILHHVTDVSTGNQITARLASGELTCTVIEVSTYSEKT